MFCEKTLTKFPNAGGSIFVKIFNGNGKEKQLSQLTSKWRLLILSYQRGCSFMLFHFITSFITVTAKNSGQKHMGTNVFLSGIFLLLLLLLFHVISFHYFIFFFPTSNHIKEEILNPHQHT